MNDELKRRKFLSATLAAGGIAVLPRARAQAPAVITAEEALPKIPYGIQLGDPTLTSRGAARALVWSKADRAARMRVEWSLDESFRDAIALPPALALESTDFTSRIDLTGLPAGRDVFVRVAFEALERGRTLGEAVVGRLRTPSFRRTDVRFVWSGDTAGQGWGIDLARGGMKTYEAMRQVQPQFFIHSGDTIYADGPIAAEKAMPDGGIWRSVVTEEKSKVAETLNEFRGCYRYNLLDDNVRRFALEVPQIWQWDDHEVVNNWSDGKDLAADTRYTEKNVQLLTARATQAFLEYAPLRLAGVVEPERVYRKLSQGPLLDIFMIDMRSYRGANSNNLQTGYGPDSYFLGPQQLAWLKHELKESKALWKVICADMPIGLQVGDGTGADGRARWEAVANADPGMPLGREQEIARLLRFIRDERVRNVVWLTADVHYCAAHFYNPQRAAFRDFDPFWEFVSGPLHAGAFGPNALDNTFGIEVAFQLAPPAANMPPADDNQFFGQVDIDGHSGDMTVALKNRAGSTVFSKTLDARRW
jgi:alkaline phosphatase D